MKKYLVLFAFTAISAPAFADYYCEAYCKLNTGSSRLLTERADHPVDALNKLTANCYATYGDNGNIYVFTKEGPNSDVPANATVSNACTQFDYTCRDSSPQH